MSKIIGSLHSGPLAVAIGLLVALVSLGVVGAIAQTAFQSVTLGEEFDTPQPTGYVRVIDGNTLEAWVERRSMGVRIVGIDVPPYNTACGEASQAGLQRLTSGGVVFEGDPSVPAYAGALRLLRVKTKDSRSIAAELVAAGLARGNGQGSEAATLSAAETQARSTGTGCVWGGPMPSLASASEPSPRVLSVGSGATTNVASVPDNFVDDIVASGFPAPTDLAFLPDGRALVTDKWGRVWMVTSAGRLSTPVLDIRSEVNNYWDRGILGIAVDPAFATNSFFYLYYTYEHNASQPTGPKTGRIVRYTLQPNNTANGATVILGSVAGDGCPDPSTNADCMPADGPSHQGGNLQFSPDGTLWVTTGDATDDLLDNRAFRTQIIDSLAGKVLRITLTGQGVPGNPFFTGGVDANAPRAKVWAYGLRNPFRASFRAGPDRLYVGDVGWDAFEEINVATAGANFGWPCYEGDAQQAGYAPSPNCQALYAQGPGAVRPPTITWDHTGTLQAAALGGAFYTGTAFPQQYQGAYFFGDYSRGWIASVQVNAADQLTSTASLFAQNIQGPVKIAVGPDGALYYLALNDGAMHRIRYVGTFTPIQCPTGQFRAEYFNNQTLAGAPTFQQCEAAIDQQWGAGSIGHGIGVDHFSARWTGQIPFSGGIYKFTAIANDGVRVWVDGQLAVDGWRDGATTTFPGTMTVTSGDHTVVVEYYENVDSAEVHLSIELQSSSALPTATITRTSATTPKVGDVVQLQGSATDPEDGQLSSDKLSWTVVLVHCPGFGTDCHTHPFLTTTGSTVQFTIPDHGDGTLFAVTLTATDGSGSTGTTTLRLDPQYVQVRFVSNPPGATIVYDGTPRVAPFSATTLAGSTHNIVAPANFVWTHGGPAQQDVRVGDTGAVYMAQEGSLPAGCTPHPPVRVVVTPLGSGRMQVSVSSTPVTGVSVNAITHLIVDPGQRAEVEMTGQPTRSAAFVVELPPGATQASFTIHRTAPGPITVPFIVLDACGPWQSFVGWGASSF
jgi:glucose/arabinose dehydrogenase